jgi:hypothetical protein
MVSGRSPIAVGFDTRAYYQGSQIMETLAQRLGGRTAMGDFLSWLYQNRSFMPFNTMELAGFYRDIAVLAFPTPGDYRIENIKGKSDLERYWGFVPAHPAEPPPAW